MNYDDIKDNITRIIIGFLALATVLVIILGAKNFYDYINAPKYTKAICQVNCEELELKINKIKKLENGEYLFTDDEGQQWQLSSRTCTFIEE